MKRTLLLAALTLSTAAAHANTWIRINQLGYLPHATKVAVMMSTEQNNYPMAFELIDAATGQTVYHSTAVKPTRALDCAPTTARLNFSDFTTEGSYRIRIGENTSPAFTINNKVYAGTADFLLNYMRQQQCGYNPFQDDSCHTLDAFIRYHPEKEGQHLDVRGGWHDAADLLQYTSTTANAIYQLMLAYERNPNAFGDHYDANGRPGANNIPDIVDQIKWGLDWLDRMNPAPGELYNQVADDRDHIGTKMPKDDPADYGRGPRGGRPVYYIDGRPQQRGKFLNATLGAASTAGKFAADFALGSRVLAPFYPDFAKRIGTKAEAAYQVGIDKPGNTQTVSVVSPYIYEEDNWVDDMELGAYELWRHTGNPAYLTQAVEYGRREPVTPWMGADSARHYQWYPFMNMGHVRLATDGETPRLRNEFIRNLRAGIERVRERADDHPFMWGVPGIWCSNNLTTALLTQCILYRQLTGDRTYEEMEGSLRDWLLGCNPWGTSMIVELPIGGTYPHAPHSNWTFQNAGFPTGGLVDGPVYATIFNSLKGVNLTDDIPWVESNAYLDLQPGDVVYHDFTHDYSTNEPTMDGTACLTFPFSTYETEGQQATRNDRNVYEYNGIVRADTTQKRLALIFTAHDRYDGAETIIKTLRQTKVPGSFFFTGEFYENHPDIIRRIQADGHYLGSHSDAHLLYAPWKHRDSCLVSRDSMQTDLLACYQRMARFGITTANAPYFVPPYEWYNAHNASWARQLGLQIVNFTNGTLTNEDYTFPGIEAETGAIYRSNDWLWNRLLQWETDHTLNGHLLMIHFGTDPRRTEKFYTLLPQLITTLRARGYQFVDLNTLLNPDK